MTPFEKKFPNADENTVFKVVCTEPDCFTKGELVKLHKDDNSCRHKFVSKQSKKKRWEYLDNIEIAEQEYYFIKKPL